MATGADVFANLIILGAGILGIVYAVYQRMLIAREKLPNPADFESAGTGAEEGRARPAVDSADATALGAGGADDHHGLVASTHELTREMVVQLHTVYDAIREGANAFLFAEYRYMVAFIGIFGTIVLLFVAWGSDWTRAAFSLTAFVFGSVTSIVSGFVGMRVAVFSNARTTMAARRGYADAFALAFRGGAVMGYALTAMALLVLYFLVIFFNAYFDYSSSQENAMMLMDALAGYGLGGSSIAMFGRVGGGIYTKAADVGADLVGKVEKHIPEDDPRNPGTIADNVGDNVGDVAGMGADLFGSFAESSCAALIVAASSPQLYIHWYSLMYPLVISALGIFVCWGCSFLALTFTRVTRAEAIEWTLKVQLWATTLAMTPLLFFASLIFLPSEFVVKPDGTFSHWYDAFLCVTAGLWAGLCIGLITEYFTSHAYTPVREVARACTRGTSSNIIYGLALGYKSAIVPVVALAITIWTSFYLCGMFGVAIAALGMLSTLATGLTIDAYGPISDNAGGIAEMCEMGKAIRDRTDALDAAGNTTAAIGKGFAIGSAALVSLALFGAFVTRAGIQDVGVDILQPMTFAGLLIGAMIPFWFFALTMKSVGIAANKMVDNIREQFADGEILARRRKPDYQQCVKISTDASLHEMLAPGALVMLTPLVMGGVFGVQAVCGLLAGALVAGVQMAISSSNTGGAWDNAKKYIEAGIDADERLRKGTPAHAAAVNGDTVGDPLKDTSGPALNIVMKLMAIISVVFAPFFANHCLFHAYRITTAE